MSFDEEWASARSGATSVRLNQLPADPGGGGDKPDLKTNAPGKAAAINALETKIQPDTQTAGVVADVSTEAAVTEFTDWGVGAGLKDAHAEWELQVKSLQGRLSADKSSLQGTQQGFGNYELGLKSKWTGLVPPNAS
ncbi:hypothetical protein OG427_23755 [Streptomyces sp. NBC_00133]|uniref:hypothetical protein n=1 Tax=Streptomyces sp. NBC_00133 TaxID=2903624 RepID=UPI0032549733